jgi:hypothetical protein
MQRNSTDMALWILGGLMGALVLYWLMHAHIF